MKTLTNEQTRLVSGGEYDPYGFSYGFTDSGGGSFEVAGAWDLIFKGAGLVSTAVDAYNAFIYVTGWGVAGSGGNENDNGGTSYGIGECTAFGCP